MSPLPTFADSREVRVSGMQRSAIFRLHLAAGSLIKQPFLALSFIINFSIHLCNHYWFKCHICAVFEKGSHFGLVSFLLSKLD